MTFLGVPCLASSRIAPCLSRPIISLSRGMFCWRVSATSMKLSMAPSLAQDQGGKIRIPQRGIFTVLLTSGHPIFFCVDPLCDSLYDQVLPFYVAMGVPNGEILPDNGRKF